MNQQLFSKIIGQGPPLIILHGLLGTSDNWQTIANRLAENFTVCLLDLRNHGRSFHSDVFNYEAMVEDVILFMENNWIQSADFIGHSMGGKVAMHLSLNQPEKVTKLIVADIGVKDYPPGHLAIFDALASIDLKNLNERKEAELILSNKLQEASVVQFLLKNLSRDKDGIYYWKMNLNGIVNNYANIMKGIHSDQVFLNPTMFVRGSKSNYIQDDDLLDIAKLFPNAIYKTISNAGHWLHADQPEIFIELVYQFLRRH
jgi:pimeloyl-ACP methyl ester carboxylesterase